MRRTVSKLLALVCAIVLLAGTLIVSDVDSRVVLAAAGDPAYQFKNVTISGGGYFCDVFFSPSTPNTTYVRGDNVGPLKRTDINQPWKHLVEGAFDYRPLQGCVGFAMHPTNDNILYAELGRGDAPYGLYKTTNGGASWTQVLEKYVHHNIKPPATHPGAEGWRKWNRSVAVDTNNPNVVYWGTYQDGIWRTTDGGVSWTQVYIHSAEEIQPGTRSIVIDTRTTVEGRSAVIYASSYSKGVLKSTDGGNTFAQMPTQPGNIVSFMDITLDGTLYATCENGWFRYTEALGWINITPANVVSFNEITVDPTNNNRIVAVGKYDVTVYPAVENNHGVIFRSTDGGNSWITPLWFGYNVTAPGIPLVKGTENNWTDKSKPMAATGGITLDPYNANRGYFTDAFNVWRCDGMWDTTSASVECIRDTKNIENIVGISMSTPPGGNLSADIKPASFLLGNSDVMGFPIFDVNQIPTAKAQDFAAGDYATYVTGWDYCESAPNNIVAAKHKNGGAGSIIRSYDGGRTWDKVSNPWTLSYGGPKTAMNCSDPNNFVVAPTNSLRPKYTLNNGQTWNLCLKSDGTNMPVMDTSDRGGYNYAFSIAADRKAVDTFYMEYSLKDANNNLINDIWVSRDKGVHWTKTYTFSPGSDSYNQWSPVVIAANPGQAGEVWFTNGAKGIYKSTDFGASFTKVTYFADAETNLVAFGKEAPGTTVPTIYIEGNSVADASAALPIGIYRSIDNGTTWSRLDSTGYEFALPARILAADRQIYGRIYVKSNWVPYVVYGQPSASTEISRTNWTATSNWTNSGDPNYTINTITTDEWKSKNMNAYNMDIVANMGSLQVLGSIKIEHNVDRWPSSMEVLTSLDGVNWISQGIQTGEQIKVFTFNGTVTAKYIKIVEKETVNTASWIVKQIRAYTP